MELDSQEIAQKRSRGGIWRWTLKREMKSREMELDSHSWMHCLAAELFLNSCFSDTVFVTLFRTAVETAISEVNKLHRNGEVPASLTFLFWRWLTVSSIFMGLSA